MTFGKVIGEAHFDLSLTRQNWQNLEYSISVIGPESRGTFKGM